MKKRILWIVTGIMAMALALCAAAGEGTAVPAPSYWEGPQAAAELWQGEAREDGGLETLALDLHRPGADGTRTDYRMRLAPAGRDGDTAVYTSRGEIVRVVCDENGRAVREDWENREVRGEALIGPDADGRMTLRFTDTMAAELNGLSLVLTETPPPAAEEIVREVLLPLTETETGTAGASLKKAQTAAALIRFAVQHRLYAVNGDELEASMEEALESAAWTPDRREAFRANAEAVFALIRTFAGGEDPEECAAARLLMEDAGVAEETAQLLLRAVDRLSVEALIGAFGMRTGN